MTSGSFTGGTSYQVALAGACAPAYLSAFAELGVRRATTCSVLHVALPEGQGVLDITAALQARDLVILGIRRVTPPPPPPPEESAPPRRRPLRVALGS
jgi:hypothetical protein